MDLSDLDWERLDRYVSRRGTPDELAALGRWVESNPELSALAEAMRTVDQAPGANVREWDQDAAWRRVARRMRWPAPAQVRGFAGSLEGVRWLPWMVAASLMLAAGSTLYLIEVRGGARQAQQVAPVRPREIVTHRGQRSAFNLTDGTQVMLGAESRLTIPDSYGQLGAGRSLSLDGQGYFVVTHDSLRPFRVTTPLGVAEDIGTAFVVTTYPEARGLQVVVASGKVALRQHSRGAGRLRLADSVPLVTLNQGDLARLDSTGTAIVSRVNPGAYLAWTQGALVFDGTPLRDVLPQLARWYDLDFRLADTSLAARRLTATFRDQSVSQVLDLLALSLDLRVERGAQTVTLSPLSPVHRP